jgi:hypothetical protein
MVQPAVAKTPAEIEAIAQASTVKIEHIDLKVMLKHASTIASLCGTV